MWHCGSPRLTARFRRRQRQLDGIGQADWRNVTGTEHNARLRESTNNPLPLSSIRPTSAAAGVAGTEPVVGYAVTRDR